MLKKKLGFAVLIPLVALTAFTACTKNGADDIGTRPAVLEGHSDHWKVKLEYKASGSTLKEYPTVTYLGNEKLADATVSIIRNDQDPEVIPIGIASDMVSGSSVALTSSAQIKNWKDTKQVEVEGNIGDHHFKEYVYVENKSPAAPAK
ncbi:hypothetical protein ACHHV8_26765 [Paenibacillus sp. TAB 01]|uniref:hypothetical protein n=1 Tax=Paenibacillus sp. TAB 01 TaxID=3368988 RepID=UPI003751F02D